MNRSLAILLLLLAPSAIAAEDKPLFTDMTQKAGLAGKKGAFPAWCDYDMDGNPDLFAGGRLYRNQGKPSYSFEEVTKEVFGVNSPGGKGVWADVDNNGYPDLAIPGGDKKDPLQIATLWFNNGKGKFEAKAVKGNKAEPDFGYVATTGFGDYDLDGFVDLFFVCNEDWNKGNAKNFRSFLFHNEKGKGFKDVTWEANLIGTARRYGRGVAFGDYNNDGFPDIYVSNYRIEDNFLFENLNDGTFRNVAEEKGVMGDPRTYKRSRIWYGHSIGSAWGDLNNDGNLDLWVSNLVHKDGKYGYQRGYICDDSKIYLNQGAPDFTFEDIRKKAGIPPVPLDKIGEKPDGNNTIVDELWAGAALGDFDNNGYLDAFVAQVYDLPWAFAHLYRSKGGANYEQIAKKAGIQVFDTYSGAWADYDNDGFLDLLTFGRPEVGGKKKIMLYRNNGEGGGSLRVLLRGRESNGSAVGARLTLRLGNDIMIREVEGGTSSHCQQNSPILHFGLGDRKPDVLEIRWPTGRIEKIENPIPGKVIEVTESKSPLPKIIAIKLDPEEPKAGREVSFKVNVRSPRGSRIKSYQWDMDGDNRFETSGAKGTLTHTFDKAGIHLVRVRVWGSRCATETTLRIAVSE